MKSKNIFVSSLIVFALLLLALGRFNVIPARAAGAILYVKPTISGTGDCSAWANACKLQTAITNAASGDQIWVKAGTYKPTANTDRTISFQLKDGVEIYGGFAGTETALNQRDFTANVTILSGDIGVAGNSDNSYHVVTSSLGVSNTAILDGFTISGGNANGSNPSDRGGGTYNDTGDPTLRNLTLTGNSATFGGGMFNASSFPVLTNVVFSGNSATSNGGGMGNNGGSIPTLTNVTFDGNVAVNNGGGLLDSNSSSHLINVTFSGNSATNGGGMYSGASSTPTLTNVTFSGNSATTTGGGMYNVATTSSKLTNVIIANSVSGGDCVDLGTLNPASSNNLIEDGTNNCGLTNGVNGNIIGSDPNLGALANNGGMTQTFALLAGSPAIEAGTNTGCSSTDQRGATRPQGTVCDIGAYEYLNATRYATSGGLTSGLCDSWVNACELQNAITAAISGDQIWAAAGTYKPTTTTDRSISFQLKNGVAVYGGFAGTETALNQRNFTANVTTLSGDIGTASVNTDNSYHVVNVSGTNNATILDGFTISGGNTGTYPTGYNGGGVYNNGGSPTLNNLIITGNLATGYQGGGMWNANFSNSTLTNVIFSGNSAGGGGGMFIGSNSNPTLTNVTFSGNSADAGGGMWNTDFSNSTLTNVTFSGNSATNGGGMFNNNSSNSTLTNVTFSGNSAPHGGGMYNEGADPSLTNVTFSGNASSGLYLDPNSPSSPILKNVIIANSGAGGDCVSALPAMLSAASANNLMEDATNNCGLTNGTNGNIIGSDPNLGVLANNGGTTQTFALLPGSPAIDTGATAACPTTDQRGQSRVGTCDIGAFEYSYTGTYYVTTTGSGTQDCQSWANACQLQNALRTARSGDQVWVAAGTYKPTTTTDRTISFQLKNGVAIYGGFGGTETALNQRNFTANVTILSGDIGTAAVNTDNSYHVVIGSGTNNTAVLDGFTISGGYAYGTGCPGTVCGGGIYNSNGSPTLANLTITSNSAYFGGGIYNTSSSPVLTNVTIFSNSATDSGGGMYNTNSSPTLTHVVFSANSVSVTQSYGGGMFNTGGAPVLTDVTFTGNHAGGYGGGMHNDASNPALTNITISGNSAGNSGGGISDFNNSAPTLTNVTFSGNTSAAGGGGMYNKGSSPTLINVTFSGNSAGFNSGGGMFNNLSSAPTLTNVIIANSTAGGDCLNSSSTLNAASSNNLIEDATNNCGLTNGANGNIVGSDPKLGALANNGGVTQTFALLPSSPAMDAGTNTGCPTNDQRGQSRVGTCDIGAFESQGFTLTKSGGDNQSALINTAFASSLQITVTPNLAGDPVDGGTVTFTAPASGASVTPITQTVTIASGAASQAVTANGTTGAYAVTANSGGATSVSFSLSNTVPAMNVKGNNANIANGANTPATTNDTDFGLLNVASGFISHPFTIQNLGAGNLSLTGTPKVVISGTNAADFSVTIQPASLVAPSGATNFTVKFDPSAVGTRTAMISIANTDASKNPYTFAIKGWGAVERANNGGFNMYPTTTAKIPTNWAAVNFSVTDGKDTVAKKEGAAAVKITNTSAVTKTLTQTLSTLAGAAGTPFKFSYWVQGTSVPAAGLCQGQVILYNGATVVATKTLACGLTGSFGFTQKTLSFTAPAAYTKVLIKFTYAKASGTVRFDGVSLLR